MSSTDLATATETSAEQVSELVELVAPTQYLTFALGRDLFAVPIGIIREVIEFPGLTHIPLAPSSVPGVINLRGAVVPVIDLAVRFDREPTRIGKRTCIVIVEIRLEEGLAPIGIIVDSVSEALDVEPSQIEQRPAFGSGLRSDFVAAMLNVEGRFVVVLDMEHVLSIAELEQLVSGASGASSQRESSALAH